MWLFIDDRLQWDEDDGDEKPRLGWYLMGPTIKVKAVYIELWQLMASFEKLLQIMAMFGNFLRNFGNLCQLWATFGTSWQLLAIFENF